MKEKIFLPFVKSFLWALTLLVGCLFVFGTYYEEYQALFSAFYSGAFSPGVTFRSWYFMADIGLSYIYTSLYQTFPGVEWVSLFLFFYMTLAAAILFCVVEYMLRGRLSRIVIAFVQAVLFFLVFASAIVDVNFTRVSYLLCGVSLLAILVWFDGIDKIKKHLGVYITLCLVYLIGTLNRSESSLAMVLIFSGFSWVWYGNIRRAFQVLAIPGLIAGAVVLGIMIDIRTTDKYYKQLEPDVEYQFTARKNMVPISEMKTYEDSVRYRAARNMIWADPQNMPVKYIRGLIKPSDAVLIDTAQAQRTWKNFTNNFFKYKYLFLVNAILWLWIGVLFLRQGKRKDVVLLVLYGLAFIALILAQIYYTKMRDRSFSPYLFFLLLMLLALWVRQVKLEGIKRWFVALLLLVLCGVQLSTLQQVVHVHKEALKEYKALYAKLTEVAGGETLLLNSNSFGAFTLRQVPFEKFEHPEFHKVYMNEAQLTPLIQTYRNYLEKECGCSIWNFSNFYKYLLSSTYPDKVYLLSDEQRMELTFEYLKVIHGLDVKHEIVASFPNIYQLDMESKTSLYLYRLYPVEGLPKP